MTIILEYEKENPCDFGPTTIYRVVEVKGLTKKERRKKPKKVMEILTKLKETLFDDGHVIVSEDKITRLF